jgi:hypothetical protein
MTTIYGSVGYFLLKGPNNKILLYADKHDDNMGCDNTTDMAGWMKTKFTSSNIILEEVPRNEESKLEELWPTSYHTQNLKNLYLENPHIIKGSDIRTYLIPYSWELDRPEEQGSINLLEYIKMIDEFFSLKNEYCIKTLPIYKNLQHTLKGKHFMILKKNFNNFLNKYQSLLRESIDTIKKNNYSVLRELNDILDSIMEWYTIANINDNRNNVIHVGLAHSEKIAEWLTTHYKYIIEMEHGINYMKYLSSNVSGCVKLSHEIDTQFGGDNGFI